MENRIESPIDLDLYHQRLNVDKNEKWKWSWELWDPIINKLFADRMAVNNISCPVCGKKTLYSFYLASHLKKKLNPVIFIGERRFGCSSCRIQLRDYGETPIWLEESEVYWASRKGKERAEQRLGRILSGPIIVENREG